MISHLLKAPSLTALFSTDNYQNTFRNHAESTALDEYVRKTVLQSEIDAVNKELEPIKVRSKISPKFHQILVLGGFCLWLEELLPSRCGLRFWAIWRAMSENADKINFRGCPSMEISYIVPTTLLCNEKWFGVKKMDGRVYLTSELSMESLTPDGCDGRHKSSTRGLMRS